MFTIDHCRLQWCIIEHLAMCCLFVHSEIQRQRYWHRPVVKHGLHCAREGQCLQRSQGRETVMNSNRIVVQNVECSMSASDNKMSGLAMAVTQNRGHAKKLCGKWWHQLREFLKSWGISSFKNRAHLDNCKPLLADAVGPVRSVWRDKAALCFGDIWCRLQPRHHSSHRR